MRIDVLLPESEVGVWCHKRRRTPTGVCVWKICCGPQENLGLQRGLEFVQVICKKDLVICKYLGKLVHKTMLRRLIGTGLGLSTDVQVATRFQSCKGWWLGDGLVGLKIADGEFEVL